MGVRILAKPCFMVEDKLIKVLVDYNDSTLRLFIILFVAFVIIIMILISLFFLSKQSVLFNQIYRNIQKLKETGRGL